MMNIQYSSDEKALNLCDILGRLDGNINLWINKLINTFTINDFSRIYMGSYYCDHYFLYTNKDKYKNIINYARDNKLKITLVIPPLFESNLEKGIACAYDLLHEGDGLIDEVTINDWGMIDYFPNHFCIKLNMGRLLQKDNRDPRYKDFFSEQHIHRCFSNYYKKLLDENNISGIELDCTHSSIIIPKTLLDIRVSVHGPWTYMSMGSICIYSSMGKKISDKFRFADKCSCECNKAVVQMECEGNINLYRFGRSIQFNNNNCKIISKVPYRYIYSPFNQLIKENKT